MLNEKKGDGLVERDLAPVVLKVDSAIHWINIFPLDSAIGFPNAYPLDSDLSCG